MTDIELFAEILKFNLFKAARTCTSDESYEAVMRVSMAISESIKEFIEETGSKVSVVK